jgi:uncharacterized membrane protein
MTMRAVCIAPDYIQRGPSADNAAWGIRYDEPSGKRTPLIATMECVVHAAKSVHRKADVAMTTTEELNMEICILRFSDTHDAEDALKEVIDAKADRYPWLHQVGAVKRPLLGKISISATYDEPTEVRQGDLASRVEDAGALTGYLIGSLVGPLHAEMAAFEGAMRGGAAGDTLEGKLMRIDDIKRVLPRDSSALVLIATREINDQFVDLFQGWAPQVIRRDVSDEIERRLHDFERNARGAVKQASP